VSTSFDTQVDTSVTAALVSALEDLTSAVSSQSESLDGLGAGPDQRISGDSVLFSRVPPLRVVVSVVLEADLYAELEASGHPATVRENCGTRTLSDVLIEDEGRGWLRIYEPSTPDSFSKTSWNLLIPLGRIEAVTSSSTTMHPDVEMQPRPHDVVRRTLQRSSRSVESCKIALARQG
jgi:hypothetical protein